MIELTRYTRHSLWVVLLVIFLGLTSCSNTGDGKALVVPSQIQLLAFSTPSSKTPKGAQQLTPTVTPTLTILGPNYDASLDLSAGPVYEPITIEIPALQVTAPILGVGLTSSNTMDAPKGPYGDPLWHTAFWYRGSAIPGEVGTATIAGHVNDLVSRPEIFASLKKLISGDVIIIHTLDGSGDIYFIVDEVKRYTHKETTTPAVLTQIFGSGPVAGIGAQPSEDGLAHLTLITCAGTFAEGVFDHYTVVYATRKVEIITPPYLPFP